jgi:hypothetical protein
MEREREGGSHRRAHGFAPRSLTPDSEEAWRVARSPPRRLTPDPEET